MEFLLYIDMRQAAGLTFGDESGSIPSPFLSVSVFGETHETAHVKETSTAAFNHTFSITKHMKQSEFNQRDVTFNVYHYQGFGLRRLLGKTVFSLKKVYQQPRHTVPMQWFPVVAPDTPAKTMGFLQMSLAAYSLLDEVPSNFGTVGNQGEDGAAIGSRAVTLPTANKVLSLYQLYVRVHRAENLREFQGFVRKGCDAFVQVDFSGASLSTSVVKGESSPAWNETCNIAFQMPCWDDSVEISLKSIGAGGQNDVLLGQVHLNITELINKEKPPTWYNFCYSPHEDESGLPFSRFFGAKADAVDSAFAGRLLLSAAVERTEKPLKSVSPCPNVSDPFTTKCVLWIDLYQVSLDGDEQPSEVNACIEIPGRDVIRVGGAIKDSRAFFWPGMSGRIAEIELDLPQPHMCFDFFVSIYAQFDGWATSTTIRYVACRIPGTGIFNWNTVPDWLEAQLVHGSSGPKNAGFVLMSVNAGPALEKPKRPDRFAIKLRKYRFTAQVFQALNLPFKSGAGGCNPYAVIFFGDAMLRTDTIPLTPSPVWKQSLTADVELPESEVLRPDILLFILNDCGDRTEALAEVRYSAGEKGALPEVWDGPPIWVNLVDSPGGPDVMDAKILVNFALAPLKSAAPKTQRYTVEGRECKVDLYAMGVRMWDSSRVSFSLNKPRLVVSWGRQADKPEEPLAEAKTRVSDCAEGNFDIDWKEKVTVSAVLSKDCVQREFLEVRLVSRDSQANKWTTVAYATIPLEQYKPWVCAEEKKVFKLEADLGEQATKKNRMLHTEATVTHPDAEPASAADIRRMSEMGGRKHLKHLDKPQDRVKAAEHELARVMGWAYKDMQDANERVLGRLEFSNLNQEDEEECRSVIKKRRVTYKHEAKKSKQGGAPVDDVVGVDILEAMAKFCDSFSWHQEEDKVQQDALLMRPDVDGMLEATGLSMRSLPYDRVPLYVGTDWGDLRPVGVLKYCCRIIDKPRPEEEKAFNAKIGQIESISRTSKDLVIRAYILSADGLLPTSGSTDDGTFVVSRVEMGERRSAHTIWDSGNVRSHTNHPQFHKCHAFSGCSFPGQSTLDISIREHSPAGASGDNPLVGRTRIDLEDRWFLERFHEMVKGDLVPIESRLLRRSHSGFGKGHLRLWVDIMTLQQAQGRPTAPLPSTEPVHFQLRVVIWKLRGVEVCFKDGEKPNIYITGKHRLDDGSELVERTDTHYNTDDGVCTLNWRLVYDVLLPCLDPRLQLRVWNDNILTDDPLAEVTLDFSRDFHTARKNMVSVDLGRDRVMLTHPAFPGEVRCELDTEARLLPMAEAISTPAGAGRDEPNEEPFLDPEDPHLVAHRDYFAGLAVVRNLADMGGSLWFAGKWLSVLYGAASVAGGICFTILSIYTLTK